LINLGFDIGGIIFTLKGRKQAFSGVLGMWQRAVYNVPYRMDKKGFRNPLFRTSEFLKPLILDSWIFKTLHFGQMGFLTPIQAGIKIKLY
jgi:hypothetical protein